MRLNHFEGGEYRAELHPVRLADGGSCRAWLYVGLPAFKAFVSPEAFALINVGMLAVIAALRVMKQSNLAPAVQAEEKANSFSPSRSHS